MNNYNENDIKQSGEQVVKITVPEPAVIKSVEKVEDKEAKNNIINIVIGVIIGLGVLTALFYLGKGIINKQNKILVESDNKEYKGELTANGNTCYDLEGYYVITRNEINEPGQNILVKYKKDNEKVYNCEYIVEEGDFELLNVKTENSLVINYAQYYSYIYNNKLILNRGTGNNREFQIYDLNTYGKIFTDNYNVGLEDLDLKENILTYWRTTNDIPNKENCSKVDEYKKMGGAKIETKVLLDLNDLIKKEFTEFRCSSDE